MRVEYDNPALAQPRAMLPPSASCSSSSSSGDDIVRDANRGLSVGAVRAHFAPEFAANIARAAGGARYGRGRRQQRQEVRRTWLYAVGARSQTKMIGFAYFLLFSFYFLCCWLS